jgi:hypothetical protein
MKDARFVKHAAGPEACSHSKEIEGLTGRYSDLNGTTVTVKIGGTNGFDSQACTHPPESQIQPDQYRRGSWLSSRRA